MPRRSLLSQWRFKSDRVQSGLLLLEWFVVADSVPRWTFLSVSIFQRQHLPGRFVLPQWHKFAIGCRSMRGWILLPGWIDWFAGGWAKRLLSAGLLLPTRHHSPRALPGRLLLQFRCRFRIKGHPLSAFAELPCWHSQPRPYRLRPWSIWPKLHLLLHGLLLRRPREVSL